MNDFLLAMVAVICADTPKSAIKKSKTKTTVNNWFNVNVNEHKFGFPL